MKKDILFSLLAIIFTLCSCTMPATTVRTVDDRPTLAFKGVPEGALLYIDGLNMGSAAQYNGEPNVLTIEPGTHIVRVTFNNEVIYEQRIFVESSLKTITIR
jgi:uncharacterized lipoprotein YajG